MIKRKEQFKGKIQLLLLLTFLRPKPCNKEHLEIPVMIVSKLSKQRTLNVVPQPIRLLKQARMTSTTTRRKRQLRTQLIRNLNKLIAEKLKMQLGSVEFLAVSVPVEKIPPLNRVQKIPTKEVVWASNLLPFKMVMVTLLRFRDTILHQHLMTKMLQLVQ